MITKWRSCQVVKLECYKRIRKHWTLSHFIRIEIDLVSHFRQGSCRSSFLRLIKSPISERSRRIILWKDQKATQVCMWLMEHTPSLIQLVVLSPQAGHELSNLMISGNFIATTIRYTRSCSNRYCVLRTLYRVALSSWPNEKWYFEMHGNAKRNSGRISYHKRLVFISWASF